MKAGWQKRKLAEVILDIKDGGTPSRKNPEYFGGDVHWCVVKDIKPLIFDTAEKLTREGLHNCSAKVWPVDSVIISLGATIGQIGIAKVPTATKQGLAGIVVNKQIMTPEFLAYGLLGQKQYIQSLATGATIKEIRPTRFAETIQLPVPPLSEQQRIVGLLDEAFEGIASAKTNAEKNLQNARELFESELNAVFSRRGGGSVETTLGEAYDVRDGTHDSPKYQASGYPLITSKNLRSSGLSFDGVKLISEADYNKINERSAVHRGDVLFAMIGTIGNPAVVEIEPRFAIKNVALFKVPNGQSGRFLKHYLDSEVVKSKMAKDARGTTQKFVGLGYLRAFPIVLPPPEKQNVIVKGLDDLREETQRLESIYERKLGALEALKKSLLNEAITGQLTAAP